MDGSGPTLRKAFLEDHRRLIRGLSGILEALEQDDLGTAVERADALDRDVGAHIELEERDFYPLLRPRLGPELVARLYQEHAAGRQAIETLLEYRGRANELDDRTLVIERLETMRAHAQSCGSLLSHLDRESEERLGALLERLQALRDQNPRWTEVRRH